MIGNFGHLIISEERLVCQQKTNICMKSSDVRKQEEEIDSSFLCKLDGFPQRINPLSDSKISDWSKLK